MTHAKAYAAALLIFFAIDALWLGVVASDFYASQLGHILSDQPKLMAAGLFYLGYGAAIVFFAIDPALTRNAWRVAARKGAILGLVVYGAYELSNFATLPGWPLAIVPVDMVWGAAATGLAAAGGFLVARKRS